MKKIKDFERIYICGTEKEAFEHKENLKTVSVEELRKEAIQFMKLLTKNPHSDYCLTCKQILEDYKDCNCGDNTKLFNIMYETDDYRALIRFLQYFFDISDKEIE